MTQYTGEASTKQKLRGVCDGIFAAITQRLHEGKTINDETLFKSKLKEIVDTVHDASEEGTSQPKDLPSAVAKVHALMAEHVPPTHYGEPKMVTAAIRNLIQEADTIGKGK